LVPLTSSPKQDAQQILIILNRSQVHAAQPCGAGLQPPEPLRGLDQLSDLVDLVVQDASLRLCGALTRIDGKHRGESEEMSQEFKQGDRVTWKSHGGNAEGEVLARSPRIPSWRAGR
jgi:hypothetical protein